MKRFLTACLFFGSFISLWAQTPSATTSTVTVSPPVIPTNGTSTITVQLKEANGANLTSGGATVSFVSPSSGTIGSVTDNGNGTYTAIYTAGATTGTVTITPIVGGTNFSNTKSITVATARIKANNTDGTGTGNSWVGGTAPGTNDIGVINSTFAQTDRFGTGAPLSWLGLQVTSGSTLVDIDNTTVANYLGTLAGGIDMSQATRDLKITSFQQQASHTWNVAANRTLTIGNSTNSPGVGLFTQNVGTALSLAGAGTINLPGPGTGVSPNFTTDPVILGDISNFSGTLNPNGHSFGLVVPANETSIITNTNVLNASNLGSSSYISIADGGTLEFNTIAATSVGWDWYSFLGTNGVFTVQNVGQGKVTISGSGNIGGTNSANQTFVLGGSGDGEISRSLMSGGASVALRKEGTGTWTLSNTANGYSGTTTINEGTLEVTGLLGNGTNSVGTYAQSIVNNAAFKINSDSNQTLSGVISGTGELIKDNTGVLTLAGANTYSGGTTLAGGTIALGSSGALGSTGAITLSGGTLQYSVSNTVDYSSRFSSAANQLYNIETNGQNVTFASNLSSSNGLLTKTGAGTLTLSGNNSFGSGTLTLGSGTLDNGSIRLASDNALGNYTAVDLLANNAGIGGLQLSGDVTITGKTLFSAGRSNQTTSGFILRNISGDNSWDGDVIISNTGGRYGFISDAGTLTLSNGVTTSLASSLANREVEFSGAGDFSVEGITGGGSLTGLNVTKSGSGTLTLTGPANSGGSLTVTDGVVRIDENATVPAGDIFVPNGTLEFNRSSATTFDSKFYITGTGSAPTFLNNGTGLVTVAPGNESNIGVDNGEPFTIGGSGDIRVEKSVASGGNGALLTKVGTGTVTLVSSQNNWSGGTTIEEGVLQVGDGTSDGTIGTGNITLTNGRLAFNRVNPYTVAENFNSFQANTTPGIENNGSGLVTINASNFGFSAAGITLELGGTGDGVVDGPIASGGAAANILKDGNGTWTFNDPQTNYSGTTTINAGTLEITGRLGQGTYAQSIINNAALKINSTSAQTLSGVISGTGELLKQNTGTLTLSGTNSYTGNTTVSNGKLLVSGALAGSNGTYSGDLVNNSEVEVNSTINQTYAGALSGSGAWIKDGTGTLTWDGANTSTGSLTIKGGVLRINENSSVPTGDIFVPNGTLEFNRSSATTFDSKFFIQGAGSAPTFLNNGTGLVTIEPGSESNIAVDNNEPFTIGGSGDIRVEKSVASGGNAALLTKVGSGTVTLVSSNNNYSGGTTISEGVLQIGDGTNDGTIGTGLITISNGRIAFNRPNPYTITESFATFIVGTTPGIENNGSGLLTVNAGNLSFNNGAELTFGGTGDGAVDGPIAIGNASASMIKDGSGTWTFNGNNGYTGTTTVNAGTLLINGDQSAATGTVMVASGATLGGFGTVGGVITFQNGSFFAPGTSPGILTAANGLTLSTGSTFNWELVANTTAAGDRGTAYDGVNVTGGGLTIQSGVNAILDFTVGVDFTDAFWQSPQQWLVFDNGNAPTLNSSDIFDNISFSVDSNNVQLNTIAGAENSYFFWTQVGNDVYLNYQPLGNPSLTLSTLTASPNVIAVNGTSTLTVQLKDQNGNNFSNSVGTVTFATTLGSVGTVTDNQDGTYTATFTAGATTGTATVTASLDNTALTNTEDITIVTQLLSGNQVIDGTSGNTQVTDVFTTDGNLTLEQGFFVDYLIVGGGGSGGGRTGGGGGAGEYIYKANHPLTATSYAVTVGAGGGQTGASSVHGNRGGNSSFAGITANGGGAGAGANSTNSDKDGGSGGGGTRSTSSSARFGGASIKTVGGLGNAGGTSNEDFNGAGGGGAGSAGGNNSGGAGGAGVANDITGVSQFYAAGGGGGVYAQGGANSASPGNGGSGVGGNGGKEGTQNPTSGVTNTGSGGGGGGGDAQAGMAGGSGVVIVRYKGAEANSTITASAKAVSILNNSYQLYEFTTVGSGNSFDLSNAQAGSIITNDIGGSGNFTYSGPGLLILNANNTYTGPTTISAGTLQIGNGGTTGSLGTGAIINNAKLLFNRSNSYALGSSNAISGSGTVEQIGAGTLDLGGITSHTAGTWILRNGSISNGTLAGNFTLESGSIAALLGGSGNLTKNTGGTVTLSGNNNYSGTTTLNAGTLIVNGTHSGTGATAVNSGARLKGTGSLAGTTTVNTGANVEGGNSIGTLGFDNLTLAGGGNYNWQIDDATGTAGTNWDQLNVSGTLNITATSGNKFNINVWTLLANGQNGELANFNPTESLYTWTIITAGSITGFDAAAFQINTDPINGTGGLISSYQVDGFTVIQQGNDIVLLYDPPAAQTIDGTNNGTEASNYTTSNTAGALTLDLGFFADYLIVGGGGGGGTALNHATFRSGGGGAGELIYRSKQLLYKGQNSNPNPIAVSIGNGGSTQSHGSGGNGQNSSFGNTIAFGGGGGAGNINDFPLVGGSGGGAAGRGRQGAISNTNLGGFGNPGGNAGTGDEGTPVAGGGGGAGSRGKHFNEGGHGGDGYNASTVFGTAVGSSGWFAAGGGGGQMASTSGDGGQGGGGKGATNTAHATIGAANTGSGGGGGTASRNGGAGGSGVVIVRYEGDVLSNVGGTVSSFTGNGTIGLNGVPYQVHTFTSNGNFDLSQVDFNARLKATLSGNIIGTGDLIYNGLGTLTLPVQNTYTGNTYIGLGQLRINHSNALGTGFVYSGTSNGSGSGTNGVLEISGDLNVANALKFYGNGSPSTATRLVNVSGDNTISGNITLDFGGENYGISSEGGSLLLSGDISAGSATSNRTLYLRGEAVGKISGLINGTGFNLSIIKEGNGVWELSGANTYTGSTAVNAGTLVINGGQSGATGTVAVNNGATLKGTGTVGGTTSINSGATLKAADAIGEISFSNDLNLESGGHLNWKITDATGNAGTNWDKVNVTGALNINATNTNTFNINIWSVLANGQNGQLTNFNPTEQFYEWTLIEAGSITGFSADKFTVHIGANNGAGGLSSNYQVDGFEVIQDGNKLVLRYDPPAAQTLDGTNNGTEAANYTTSNSIGSLTLDLGFFSDYLIVGGGGGGGTALNHATFRSGGGGAGELIYRSKQLLYKGQNSNPNPIAVSIGNGGTTQSHGSGGNGQNSSFGNTIAFGGGGGAGNVNDFPLVGGSGGGAGRGRQGALSNTNSGGFGNPGGNAGSGDEGTPVAGGGGGAGSRGKHFNEGGHGGDGYNASTVFGTAVGSSGWFAAGGGGGQMASTSGDGGQGGGGKGATNTAHATIGAANTGSGGGGGTASRNGGAGGSGVVIVRYEGDVLSNVGGTVSSFTGNGTIGLNGVPYQVHTFTSSGNFDLSQVDFNARLKATLSGNIIGTGDLIYDSQGRLNLTGSNHTYTGSTSIQNGELRVNSDITNSSGVTVASAATLSGTGTLPATVVNGTHSPGNSPGLQTFSGNLTYNANATLNWELAANGTANRGTDYDAIDVTGDLDFSGATTLNLIFDQGNVDWTDNFWNNPALGTSGWKLFEVSGTTHNLTNLSINVIDWEDGQNRSLSDGRSISFSLYQDGQDVYLVYDYDDLTWTGTTSTAWTDKQNFSNTFVPAQHNAVSIPDVTPANFPVVTTAIAFKSLQIDANASLSLEEGASTGSAAIANNGTITAVPSTSLAIDNAISGSGTFLHTGTGTTSLTAHNTFTGGTTVQNGTLVLAYAANGNGTLRGAVSVENGATLEIGIADALGYQNNNLVSSLQINQGTVTGDFKNHFGNSGNPFSLGVMDGTLELGGTAGGTTANDFYSPSITVTGTGTSIIDRATSNTTASMRLRYLNDDASTPGEATIDVATGATLELRVPIYSSNASGTTGSGGASVIKNGAGTLRMFETSPYTGPTTINAGTLSMDNSANISASSLLSIASTATLSGTGTLPATEVNGTHSPGSSAGVQTVAGDLTYKTGSKIDWELFDNVIAARGVDFDGIDVTGDLDFEGATTLNLIFDQGNVDWTANFWDNPALGTNGWKLFEVSGTTTNLTNLSINVIDWVNGQNQTYSSQQGPAIPDFKLEQIGNAVYINYEPILPDLTQSTLTASLNTIAINNTSTLTVQLKDQNGNNFPNSGGTITFATTLGSVGTVTDNQDGTYTATFTAGASTGTATVTASLDNTALTNTEDITIVLQLLSGNQVIDGTSGNTQVTGVFTTDGNLTLSQGFFVDYLIVGGGGGGGSSVSYSTYRSGGGGAGGLIQDNDQLSATNHSITIGAGGGVQNHGYGSNGGNSIFNGKTANGGGGGAGLVSDNGASGGSGGGAGGSGRSGGTGNQSSSSSGGFGNNGGTAGAGDEGDPVAAGGGGAGQAGRNSSQGGHGGSGLDYSTLFGTSYGASGWFAAGGGGGQMASTSGDGGQGGGGKGATHTTNATAGINNTGSGGGGGTASRQGASGGSGIVLLRYKGSMVNSTISASVNPESILGDSYQMFAYTSVGSSNNFDLTSAVPGAIINNEIIGSGDLIYNGPGRLTLPVQNTYTGNTYIGLGQLRINHSNALGTGYVYSGTSSGSGSGTNGALEISGDLNINNAIKFYGNGTASTSRLVNVSGTNTLSGNITLDFGGEFYGISADGGSLLLTGNVERGNATNNRTLYLRGEAEGILSGMIDGSGFNLSIIKEGNGVWELSGANTYTGSTTVNAGALVINGSQSGATGTLAVNNGATLKGLGTVGGTTTINSGATLKAADAIGEISFSNDLNLQSGGHLNWKITDATGNAGSNWDKVNVTGALNINATNTNTFNINIWSVLANGQNGQLTNFNPTEQFYEWTLIEAGSITGFSADKFTVHIDANNGAGGLSSNFQVDGFEVIQDGNKLVLRYDPPAAQTIDGTNNGTEVANYTTSNSTGSLTLDLGFFSDYLIVGGGGGGGTALNHATFRSGGGGAGELIYRSKQLLYKGQNSNPNPIAVSIGNGGTTQSHGSGGNGQNSSFGNTIAFGGGGGAGNVNDFPLVGGSGGGAAGRGRQGATSNTSSGGWGHPGGNAGSGDEGTPVAGGGGGAGSRGKHFNEGGHGGDGYDASTVFGTNVGSSGWFAAGGGGGQMAATSGDGGQGGGGKGATHTAHATIGAANTGSGGGGGTASRNGGAGGSGVVIIRYEGDALSNVGGSVSSFTGNGTIGLNGVQYQVHTFASSGNFDLSQVDFDARLKATLSGNIVGTGDLIYNSQGRLNLTGTNHTYTGSTSIQNGELRVNSDISSSSGVAVSSTATLSGTGTLPATEVNGTHSPGSSAGVQTVDGNLTYKTGSTINWELFANGIGTRGTDYDGIDVTGDLDFEGVTTLNLVFNETGSAVDFADNFWEGTYTDANGWLLFDVTGSSSSISNLNNLSIVVGNDKNNVTLSTAQPDANGFSLKVVNNKVYLEYTNGSRWTGTTNTDWHTASNWEPALVPDVTMLAVIPDVTNKPIISAAQSAEVKILSIAAQAKVTVAAGGTLQVEEDVRNDAVEGIVLQASSTSYAQLKFKGDYTATGNGKVRMQQVISGIGWHNIANPFATQTAGSFGEVGTDRHPNAQNLFGWDAGTAYNWVNVPNNAENLENGKGYFGYFGTTPSNLASGIQTGSGPWTVELEGTPITSVTPTLGFSPPTAGTWQDFRDPNQTDGWNLIANPFTASLDFASLRA
jgi:autotransporter-associated beta strand protein